MLMPMIKWIIYIYAIVLGVVFVSGCMMPEPLKQEQKLFATEVLNNPLVSHHLLTVNEDVLHYAAAGNPKNPSLIIIHGTPGSWQQYARYIIEERLLEHFYMIVIDRPGWGGSVLAGEHNVANFKLQSSIIGALIKQRKEESGDQAVILLGHSLGASLAPQIAMDHPEWVDGLMLFAGTLSPELATPRWYNRIAAIPGVGWFAGESLMRANEEIFALKANLEQMELGWADLQAKYIVVQGMKDNLVYPENIDYAQQVLNPANGKIIRLQDQGHLFPMTKRDRVMDWALELLEMIQ